MHICKSKFSVADSEEGIILNVKVILDKSCIEFYSSIKDNKRLLHQVHGIEKYKNIMDRDMTKVSSDDND